MMMTYAELQTYVNCLRRRYHNMKQLCYGQGNGCRTEKCYRGKGISVCDEWLDSFESFFDWSVQHGYETGKKLERIDKDGNFCPDNCRWVTMLDKSKDTEDVIASNVRTLRVRSGKTQREVANAVGIGTASICNWELGRSAPSMKKLLKLAEYYGVDICDIVSPKLEEVIKNAKIERNKA